MNGRRWVIARTLPVVLVLIGTVVAFDAGVDVSERPGVPAASPAVQLYYALGLFVLGGIDLGVPTGGPVWARTMLWVAYFLGPAITTTAVVEGALRLARPRWLGQVRNRSHVVVVGDGRVARLYAEAVAAEEPGRRVVLAELGQLGALEARETLRLDRAHAVVVATEDDLANLGTAWEVARAHPAVPVVAHVAELGTRRGATELVDRSAVRVFNAHEITAAELFRTTLQPHLRATVGRDVIVIVGFGRFGQTVLRFLQEHTRGAIAHVRLVDTAADRLVRQYAEQVGLDPDLDVQPLQADIRDPATWDRLASILAGFDVEPALVLATDDDNTNLQAAIGMRKRLPTARLFVRYFTESPFVEEVEAQYGLEGFAVESILRVALRTHYAVGLRG
ncbi:MAG: Trk K+ transport system NAD-binding subunit [Myxococcota bacterium]